MEILDPIAALREKARELRAFAADDLADEDWSKLAKAFDKAADILERLKVGKNPMLELTAKNVETIFLDCLFRQDEIEDAKPKPGLEMVAVKGIIQSFGFNKVRVDLHKEEIRQLLSQLPEPFREDIGGGWTFLNGCVKQNGDQWGEQRNVEQLMALGIASEQAKIQTPKELWDVLPGGVPYFSVKV